MSKNRLFWIVGMILIIVLPIVHAQTISGSSQIILILINAAIVAVVLFILQAFMIPKADGKEKTAVWIGIIILSLFIAWYFGRTDFIWRSGPLASFFEIHVIVNALIIGIVLYFALGFMGVKEKLGKLPEAQTGYGILIFIGSLVWAIGIASSYGKLYVWQAYSYFISYFIGPEGILNPYPPQYRLLVFAGSFTLLAFFFNNYLLENAKTPRVNYGLALILSMNMASSGVSVKSVIILGEIVFVLVLQRALLTTTKDNVWLSWFLAILLVGWASAAMTYDTQYQGFLGGIIGFVWKWGGWGSLVVIAIIIMVVLMGIGRGIGKDGMFKEAAKRVWKEALDRLRRIDGVGRFLTDTASVRNPVFENELTPELRDIRYELYVLMNFMLRHDIFKAKTAAIVDMRDKIIESEKIFAGNAPTEEDIRKSMKDWIEGSEIVYENEEWKWKAGYGWGRNYLIVYKIMERLRDILSRDLTLPPDERAIQDARDTFRDRFEAHTSNMLIAYGKYETAIRRYKAVSKIRAIRLRFLDMYNLFGKITRGYFFAKLHAKPDYYTYDLKADSKKSKVLHKSIDWSKAKHHHTETAQVTNFEEGSNEYLLEVDMFGYCVKDINAIQIEKKNIPYIRRFKKDDRVFLPKPTIDWDILKDPRLDENAPGISDAEKIRRKQVKDDLTKDAKRGVVFSDILEFSSIEWSFFLRDMEKGQFHPFSKTVVDYEQLIKAVHIDLTKDKVTFKGLLDQDKDLAFDREALRDPGTFVYWGKDKYFAMSPDSLKKFPANPYPMASILGIWSFINQYSSRLAGDLQTTERFLEEYFKMEYPDLGKVGRGEKSS